MINFILNFLNNVLVGIFFILATMVSSENVFLGVISFTVAFIYLDFHSYIEKKLNYSNNLFIKS